MHRRETPRYFEDARPALDLVISIHLYLCLFFNYFCCIVVVFITCYAVSFYFLFFIFSHKNFMFDVHSGTCHLWRTFASTAENWHENSKISFFHYLWSLVDILTQFWILNFEFFQNCFLLLQFKVSQLGDCNAIHFFKLGNIFTKKADILEKTTFEKIWFG